ncbi:MAG: hypothetical protein ACJ74K_13480, partial [Actinomycetes bacterium]
MHGHPANVVVASLDLADVQPGANPNVDAAKLAPKGDRAVDSPPGAVEGGHDPVAGALHVLAHPSVHLRPRHLEVPVHELAPRAIADLGRLGGG